MKNQTKEIKKLQKEIRTAISLKKKLKGLRGNKELKDAFTMYIEMTKEMVKAEKGEI